MNRIDLNLISKLTPQFANFQEGADDFLSLLVMLKGAPGFNVDWNAQWERDGKLFYALKDRSAYIEKFREYSSEDSDMFSIWAHESSEQLLFEFEYHWRSFPTDSLSGDIFYPDPKYGTQAELYIEMIDTVTQWKRPQHLSFGPMVYLRDFHPLDRSRAGIRWMGWLPFDLQPSDVPEAELVRPMNGGTLVVTQMQFWQAWEANPAYSREAIERAQDVEIRLNLLGVLPTSVELARGDWGVPSQSL